MEISPIILVGGVCIVLGILAGLLINSLTEAGEDSSAATEEAPPGGRKGKYTPVFRVWREKQTGTLVVEMDGKAMTAPDPLNEIQRERLERTVRDLRSWLGMGMASAQYSQPEEPVSAAAPNAATAYRSAAGQSASAAPYMAEEDDLSRAFGAAPSSVPPSPVEQPPVQPPRVTVSRPVAAPRSPVVPPVVGKGKEEPVVPAASRSIVSQIEDILQDMIAGTEYERRGLHLLEDPIKGVIVQVGAVQYEGIGAVTDPQVKGILQAAVQEWEKSQ